MSFIRFTSLTSLILTISPLSAISYDAYRAIYHEPKAVAKSAYLVAAYGIIGDFHYRGSNPEHLDGSHLNMPVVICLQGDDSNPATFVPLIDSLKDHQQTRNMAVFVPKFDYNRNEDMILPLKRLLLSIKGQFDEAGKPLQVIFVGHSMGGILSSFYTYCLEDETKVSDIDIMGIIAISSRLAIGSDCEEKDIEGMVREIETSRENTKSRVPLYAVFGDKDWLVPIDALDVAEQENTFVAHGKSHLSALYDPKAISFVHDRIVRLTKPDLYESRSSLPGSAVSLSR